MSPPDPALSNSAQGYEAELQIAGWKLIGQGVGGRVYHRVGDLEVIKVSDGDFCYIAFAEYAQANQSTCVPKLQVVHRTLQWAVTHIEFLQPLDAVNAAAIAAWWQAYVAARRQGAPAPQPTAWSALAAALGPIAIQRKCGFDMKEANAMQRGADVVFTDPLN
jgi:hypothetical protein